MKKILSLLTLMISLMSAHALYAEEGWYPFDLTKTMYSDSSVNMGGLVLDAPAGKHGFVQANGNTFTFEDGTEAKFWGTNLLLGACFPTQEEADMMAEQIAYLGFNAVRLHVMDIFFEPKGIFEDVDYMNSDPQQKRTGFLSSEQLDRLDYLISRLKAKGIYIDMNLLGLRRVTEADSVVDAAVIGGGAKPMALFDARLIELQKQYAEDLLMHYNPYTGLKYADEPAIAIIETVNENSVITAWRTSRLNDETKLPLYYMNQLDSLWNDWLEDKYGTPEAVNQAWGLGSGSSETVISQDGIEWSIYTAPDAQAQKLTGSGITTIQVLQTTGSFGDIEYSDYNLQLLNTKSYVVSFTASADRDLQVTIAATQNYSPWQLLGLWEDMYLSPVPQNFEFTFSPPSDCENAVISFYIGYSVGEIVLENLQIKEKGFGGGLTTFDFPRPLYGSTEYSAQALSDMKDFYVDLQKTFFGEMKDFLVATCDVKCPVTGIGGTFYPEDTESQIECDFVDVHAYWDHPQPVNGDWDTNTFAIHNKSIIQNYPDWGIIEEIEWVRPEVDDRPYTVTEWNHCYPNSYAYELPLFIASEAVKRGWDGLFQFDFSQNLVPFNEPNIQDFFDTSGNPQQLILTSLGSLVYLMTDNQENLITDISNNIFSINLPALQGIVGFIKDQTVSQGFIEVTSSEDGAVLMYSPDNLSLDDAERLILVTLSQVKNTDSGWVDGHFQWGSGPTLLKEISVQVNLNTDKNYKVYALDNTGVRSIEVPTIREGETLSFNTTGFNSPWFEIVCETPSVEEGILEIITEMPFNSAGMEGGPFDPSTQIYTLENIGNSSITWTASVTESWLSLSKESGTLEPGMTDTVTVSINSEADVLSSGIYTGTVTFINTTNGMGNEAFTVSLTVNTAALPLPAPSNVSASDGDYTDYVQISWDSVSEALYYDVYRSETQNGEKVLIATTNSTVYEDNSASSGIIYYYWVKAIGSETESEYSVYDTGSKQEHFLEPPAGVTATDGISAEYVEVTWNAVDGAVSYNVYRSDSEDGTKTSLGSTNDTVFQDHTAEPGVIYYYWVKAMGSESDYSTFDTGYKNALDVPVDLTAADGTSTSYIKVKWTVVSGATAYNVYRSEAENGSKVLIAATNSTMYEDNSASFGTVYYYWVKAVSDAEESDFSLCDTGFKKPLPPTWLNATDGVSKNYVKVTWQLVPGVDYYKVYRANSPTGTKRFLGKAESNSFLDTKALRGRVYYYFIRSVFNGVLSSYSAYESGYKTYTTSSVIKSKKLVATNQLSMALFASSYITASVSTSKPAPKRVSATNGNYRNTVIRWSAVKGAKYYRIYRANSATGKKICVGRTLNNRFVYKCGVRDRVYYYFVKAVFSKGSSGFSQFDTGRRR